MHPAAVNYNDYNYWSKLFQNLSRKYKVNINFLETNLSLDNVLNSGLYPLSPKGTVGLELIVRGIPSLLLESNCWSCNFPELTVHDRKTYKSFIKKAIYKKNLNSVLKNFRPSKLHISLANSIYKFDAKDFYYSIGISKEGFPYVPFGKKNRAGKKNMLRDQYLEKIHIEKMYNKKSRTKFIKILEKILNSKK